MIEYGCQNIVFTSKVMILGSLSVYEIMYYEAN